MIVTIQQGFWLKAYEIIYNQSSMLLIWGRIQLFKKGKSHQWESGREREKNGKFVFFWSRNKNITSRETLQMLKQKSHIESGLYIRTHESRKLSFINPWFLIGYSHVFRDRAAFLTRMCFKEQAWITHFTSFLIKIKPTLWNLFIVSFYSDPLT